MALGLLNSSRRPLGYAVGRLTNTKSRGQSISY